jgi:hypothetical protein
VAARTAQSPRQAAIISEASSEVRRVYIDRRQAPIDDVAPGNYGRSVGRWEGDTLVGTIKQFKWANPHCWIEMEIPNSKGGSDIWNVEMTAPGNLAQAGWKSNTIKPGDR